MGEHYCPNSSPRNPANSGGGEELSNGPAARTATEHVPNTVSVSPSSDPRADGSEGDSLEQGSDGSCVGQASAQPDDSLYQSWRLIPLIAALIITYIGIAAAGAVILFIWSALNAV